MIKKGKNENIYLNLNDFYSVLDLNSEDDYEETDSERGYIGTVLYLPPEIHFSQDKSPNYSKQDVWAIGIIAYELCALKRPFNDKRSAVATINAIINDPVEPITQPYSTNLKDLINLLLKKDPEQRPSIQQLVQLPIVRPAIVSFVKEFEGKEY